MNMDDIFSQFGDIFGSAFGGNFGGFSAGFGQSQSRVKGSNLRIRVGLSLEEIVNGVDKKIKVKRKVRAQVYHIQIVQSVTELVRFSVLQTLYWAECKVHHLALLVMVLVKFSQIDQMEVIPLVWFKVKKLYQLRFPLV